MVRVMLNLIVGLFEDLNITFKLDFYHRVNYTESILLGPALKKYFTLVLTWKKMAKYFFRKPVDLCRGEGNQHGRLLDLV